MIRPLQDRILVKRIEAEEKTSGGIIIPDTAKEKPQEGEVVAVGKGKRLDNGNVIEPDVKAGDRVLFSKYGGTEVKVDGQDYLIMREDDILGVLSDFGATGDGYDGDVDNDNDVDVDDILQVLSVFGSC